MKECRRLFVPLVAQLFTLLMHVLGIKTNVLVIDFYEYKLLLDLCLHICLHVTNAVMRLN